MTKENEQGKREKTWYPALVLAAICAVAALLLAAINEIAEPLILRRGQEEKETTLRAMFPELYAFESAVLEEETGSAHTAERILDKDGALLGYVVSVSPNGFKGAVELLVGFDPAGTVRAVAPVSVQETPGIGDRATDGVYLERFRGLGIAQGDRPADAVDSVSGATVSSKAVRQGINDAVNAVRELIVKDGGDQ